MYTELKYVSWGATQALMIPIFKMTENQIDKSIKCIKTLIDSKRFRYDIKILTNRLKELSEQKDFLCQK